MEQIIDEIVTRLDAANAEREAWKKQRDLAKNAYDHASAELLQSTTIVGAIESELAVAEENFK